MWERSLERARVESSHTLNHPAAITPVTDGETVYSFFPEYGLVAYDVNGKERWRTPLGPFSNENGHVASRRTYWENNSHITRRVLIR